MIYHGVTGPRKRAQAKPLKWWAPAQLEDVRLFLKAERDCGRFQPLLTIGLD